MNANNRKMRGSAKVALLLIVGLLCFYVYAGTRPLAHGQEEERQGWCAKDESAKEAHRKRYREAGFAMPDSEPRCD